MPIKNMTKEQIAEATRATITAGGKSTDPNNRLKGETATEANNRITAAYKELTAKPILTQEQINGGMKVQFVREGAGGVGMYTATKPPTYDGPTKITNFTNGIIPEGTKYATGSAVGLDAGGRTVDEFRKILIGKKVVGNPLTAKEQQWLDDNPEGSSTPSSTTKTVDPLAGKTPDQIAAYNNAKATAQQFVDLYGGQLSNYFDAITGKVTSPSKEVINKKFAQSPNTKTVTKTVPNGDGTSTITFSDGSTEVSGTKNNADGSGNGTVIKYDANGNPILTDVNPISADTRDAFATLQNLFTSYGLGSLASEIAGYMTSGLTASEALIKLKTNPSGAYAERFAGNFARTKKGLNVISEAAYIDLESSYAETLKAYGLGNMLSTDSKQNAKQFASYIENDISAVEFKDRINTVQERVVNADPAIKAMFKEFYPSLTNSDLVSYFLNPTETIGKLKEKVTSAEIGAAFTGQGLTTSLTSASDLARYGIDRAGALQGAASIAGVLPEATKLGNIYGETGVTYNQQTGEQEFLKSSDEAKRKRNLLASKERASFEGSAGNPILGSYTSLYSKKTNSAGQI